MGIGSGPTAAGITVTAQRAASADRFTCLQTLSQDIARTPIKFKQKIGEDSYEDAVDHDLFEILGSLWNPETNELSGQALPAMAAAALWAGLRRSRPPERAHHRIVAARSRAMRVDRTDRRVKRWTYTVGAQPQVWLFDPSQPPIFELVHETPLLRCRESVGTALALMAYTGKFFGNGCRPGGILKAQGKSGTDQLQRLKTIGRRRSRAATRVTAGHAGRRLDYTAIARANDESQLTEVHQLVSQQICGAFRVPVWKVGDLSKATYSNMARGGTRLCDLDARPLLRVLGTRVEA